LPKPLARAARDSYPNDANETSRQTQHDGLFMPLY
jgi:hypothetical protein